MFRSDKSGGISDVINGGHREAAETMALLDAIMEGLADSQNGALRELCASATREFLVWSAKHIPSTPAAPGKAAAGGNLNAASLLRRLFDRLAHPEPYQRCAGKPYHPSFQPHRSGS
jgi:hypothetical protein